MMLRKALWGILCVPFVLLAIWLVRLDHGLDLQLDARRGEPLRIAVTDPLCRRPAADEVPGPRRDYSALGRLLEETLDRPVEILYGRHLSELFAPDRPADLIVGPEAAVHAEAAQAQRPVRPMVRLTDEQGVTDLAGLFVVRATDPARTLGDLADHRIVFGPTTNEERHLWALATLSQNGVVPVPPLKTAPTCRAALEVLAAGEADAAVISSYVSALTESDGAAGKGAFRVVGRTTPQPFITVFATNHIGPATERTLTEALLTVRARPPVLTALKSRDGFVPLQEPPVEKTEAPAPAPTTAWTDWRGPGRAGISPDVPATLPCRVQFLWRRGMTGPGLSGVAATATHVLVADKSPQKDQDIWRCLDADTGKELWTVAYTTPTHLEFTNVPRATPVIHGSFAYLLGAFGDLYCVSLYGSGIVWHRNLLKDFGAPLPAWGTCSTPLIVGDSLIVSPGAADASLAALSLYTGETIWKTPGGPPAYGSLILGIFGGVRQIVGHDAESLGGWDPNTGRRLWTLAPKKKGDYNVPTPLDLAGRLLAATENNGARLYDFDPNGGIRPTPVAHSTDLAPSTSTPVAIAGLVFGCARGLVCLDAGNGLRTLYTAEGDKALREHAAFIAGRGRVLALTVGGELILLKAARDGFTPISRLQLFTGTEVWSHPALIGNRLYVRSMNEICCILLDG
ncbi:MAG: PhnD/SsuA/transferrin family substrate-binding protein [Planctomycetes bacterium]|jgi:ABC-type phosphate/phosphonate transport system substrate-binding protein|nr:PhnD/SsuA/transferrin family substrate-binding protein [Planctomycetota bacterium]